MKTRLAICLWVLLLVLPRVASAAVKVWDGGGADSNWMTKENWVGDAVPVPNEDSLEFPEGAARKANSNNFPSGSLFLGIHFSGSTGGYVLSGQLLLLSGPLTSSNTAGNNTITFAISTSADAALTAVNSGGSLTVGQINLLSDLALSGAGNINITGNLNSTGNVTKSGTGVTTLELANSYTGSTTVQDGSLIVKSVQTGSAITMVGGTLGGTGVLGSVGAYSGTVSPGASPGVLKVGNITMSQETVFRVELNGSAAGFSYDQLNVVGEVNLNGAVLDATLGFVPTNGVELAIINK